MWAYVNDNERRGLATVPKCSDDLAEWFKTTGRGSDHNNRT